MNNKASNEISQFVLVVDDNPSDRIMAKFLLEKNGYIPIVVNDGYEALAAAEQYPYQLILVDLQMPKMPGIELIKSLRRLPSFTKIPILTVSARNEAKDVKLAVGSGANDYIIKPIDPLIFKTKLENLIKNSESDWYTYDIPDSAEESVVLISTEQKMVSINEVGCVIRSSFNIEINFVTSLASKFFQSIDIKEILCRAVSSKNVNNYYYTTFVYVGLREEQRQKLRVVCRSLWSSQTKVS